MMMGRRFMSSTARSLETLARGGARGLGEGEALVKVKETKLNRISASVWRHFTKKPARLQVTLGGSLQHKRTPGRFPLGALGQPQNTTLPEFLGLVKKAAEDPLVETVVIQIEPLRCNFARVEEAVKAIRELSQKKRVIGYLNIGGERELAIAAACTEAYCPPGAYVALSGFSNAHLLLSGLAEKAGIKAQVTQRGTYKGGHALSGEWKEGKGVPQPVRERTEMLRDSMRAQFVSSLSDSLGKTPEAISTVLSSAPSTPQALTDAGIITGVRYLDTLTAELAGDEPKKTMFVEGRSYRNVTPQSLGLAPQRTPFQILTRKPKAPGIGVIPVTGMIQDGKGRQNAVGSEPMIKALEKAAHDPNIDAVVLRVDSPGGSALASDAIWRTACLLGREKPVIASMGDVAASGGYYIAMAAERILANPSTITGSIGVITVRLSFEKLCERLQIWRESSGGADPYATMAGDFHRDWSDAEKDRIDGVVDELYHDFIKKAAECRGMDLETMRNQAEGRVFSGAEALDNGLIDQLGGLEDAVQVAAEMCGKSSFHECRVVDIPVGKQTLLQRLTQPAASSVFWNGHDGFDEWLQDQALLSSSSSSLSSSLFPTMMMAAGVAEDLDAQASKLEQMMAARPLAILPNALGL